MPLESDGLTDELLDLLFATTKLHTVPLLITMVPMKQFNISPVL